MATLDRESDMLRTVRITASVGARTDREQDIATCAIDHIERVVLLYPGRYEPNYHVDVFEDIGELFFITLTTNRKDIVGKDSRAVGMSNSQPPFTAAEAEKIVSRTTFVSECYGVWNVEVKSFTHTGTLVEATAGDEDENLDDHGGLPSTEPITETEEEGHRTSLTDNEQTLEDQRRQAIRSVKEDLARDERAQMDRMIEIMKLKKHLAIKVAELRRVETTTLPVKRKALKNMDKEYYDKLKKHEDAKAAVRKQANEERLTGLMNGKFSR